MLLLAAAGALAQTPAPASPAPPPEATTACRDAGPDGAQPVLKNVAAALRGNRAVILAGGGSGVAKRGRAGADGYYGLVRRYLERSYKDLDLRIEHRGAGGEVARDAFERIKVEAALTGARLVLWQVGAADALARIPPPEFRATLTEAVAWLRAHDIDLVLIGMRYAPEAVKDEHYQAIRRALREVAIAESVPRVRRYEASEAIARMRAGAHAEPEAAADAAQDCMADWLAQAVAVGLFGRRGGGEARPAP
jgi:hypothetical protein